MDRIIGRIGVHKSRPERLCFILANGKPNTWFALDETREGITEALASAGLTLRNDDTVVQN